MATDVAKHFNGVEKLKKLRENQEFDFENTEHRYVRFWWECLVYTGTSFSCMWYWQSLPWVQGVYELGGASHRRIW